MATAIARLDSKGRLTIPKEIRELSGIEPGSRVLIEVRGRGEIVIKLIEKDPSEELAEILGDFEFSRRDRIEAEKLLLREVG